MVWRSAGQTKPAKNAGAAQIYGNERAPNETTAIGPNDDGGIGFGEKEDIDDADGRIRNHGDGQAEREGNGHSGAERSESRR